MKKEKKLKSQDKLEDKPDVPQGPTEKETLLALRDELIARGITRISDLENQIANCK